MKAKENKAKKKKKVAIKDLKPRKASVIKGGIIAILIGAPRSSKYTSN